MVISPQEICHILHNLSRVYVKSRGYQMMESGAPKLVHSQEESDFVVRKVVDFGLDSEGKYAIGISVAYLKERLPLLFPDDLIQ